MSSLFLLGAARAFAAAAQPAAGEGAAAGGGGGGAQLVIFIVGFILIFYFLMLRPQKKQQRERQSMLDGLKRGDRIQMNGGLLGKISAVDDKEITLLIAPDIRVKVARSAVAGVVKSSGEAPSASLDKAPEGDKGQNGKNPPSGGDKSS
ncbi:MAG: preprotein translocase subunit YajC [Deltaproteobacteria bacterium]|jgi:preprotein translocase subunit YajC|nr:preprotein translocase subunit YajC [Deltaproteobacteria bacterium]